MPVIRGGVALASVMKPLPLSSRSAFQFRRQRHQPTAGVAWRRTYWTWGEDVKYHEGAIVTWNGTFYQALEPNFGCQPGVGPSNLCFNSNDFKHWLNGGDPSAIWIVVSPPGPDIHGRCTPGLVNDGNAYNFQLCVGHQSDGSVDCSNGVTCTIADGAFTCSSPPGASVAVSKGDVLALQIGPQSDPAWCAVNAIVDAVTANP